MRGRSYEIKRAAELLKRISKSSLVVDFHTTAALAPFVIICSRKMIPLAAMVGLRHVVIMKYNVKRGHALINYRDGISIETGNHTSKKSYNLTLKIVKNILSGKKHPIKVYEVYDKITEPGRYVNFKKHHGGFIPVLAGEKEYTKAYHIYGLKAREIDA